MEKTKALWRIPFGGIFIAGILAIAEMPKIAAEKEFSLMQPKWLLLIFGVGVSSLFAASLFGLSWTKHWTKIESARDAFSRLLAKQKWLAAPLLVLAFVGVTFLEVQPYLSSVFGIHYWTKIFFFQVFLLLGAFCLEAFFPKLSWHERFALLALGQLLIYYFPTKFNYFTNSPFAIGWTSDSRHYYASLFFAEKLYGQKLPLPILHPSLHLILSVPFLFGKLPIMAHRLWSIFLFWGGSFAVTWALLRRNPVQKKLHLFLIGIWVFLYLVRGSIYAHLLLPTLLVFLFVDPQKKTRSWLVIIFASLWAGISRINWFPVPAMLAALIYLLDTPQNERSLVDYLKLPVAWFVVGVGSAFASQTVYIQISGNGGREAFYTSLSSDLLWFRLLPNATYKPGVLLGALFLSLPLLLFVGQYFRQQRRNLTRIRLLGIIAIVGVLFVGGLLVSTKIGGGADLHNMDAYFVSLLLVGGIVYTRGFEPDTATERMRGELSFPVIALALISLAGLLLPVRGYLPHPAWDRERASFDEITAKITSVADAGQDVLFIAQRNFVTFGMVDVPLVPDYEKDVLMEMAMSRNLAYLGAFEGTLRRHEYGLIVLDPQSNLIQPDDAPFALENNRWVRKITRPLLCYYELAASFDDVNVELYAPRETVNPDCEN